MVNNHDLHRKERSLKFCCKSLAYKESLGLVEFAVGLVDCCLLDRQVKFFGENFEEIEITEVLQEITCYINLLSAYMMYSVRHDLVKLIPAYQKQLLSAPEIRRRYFRRGDC